MSAVPRKPKPPAGTTSTVKEEPLSRLAQMREEGVIPTLPPNRAPHITDWLMEIGPVQMTAGDRGQVSWEEIDRWCDRIGIDLSPWQARLIRRLSAAFAAEMRAAEEPDAPAPADGIPIDRDGVGRALRSALSDWKSLKG